MQELLIYRAREAHGCARVVHACVNEPCLALGDIGVIDDRAAPAALDVITLIGIEGDRFFFPIAEVSRSDVSPVQARHVWTVAVLLEEDVVFAILVGNTVGLVGPVGRWHTVEVRTKNIILVVLKWHAQIGLLSSHGAGSVRYLLWTPCEGIDLHLINDTIEGVDMAVHGLLQLAWLTDEHRGGT